MHRPGSISLSFQSKVLIPVLAFLFLAPLMTLYVMQQRVSAQFERDAERKLKTAQRTFQSYLEKRSGFLYARYRNLVQEPRFRAISKLLAESKSPDEARSTVEDFLKSILKEFNEDEAEVMVFSTPNGKFLPLARNRDLADETFHAAAGPLIAATFTEGATNKPVVVDQKLYNAVSVPVTMNDQVIAALTVFVPIQPSAAREFASQTSSEFALYIDEKLAASTLPLQRSHQRIAQPREGTQKIALYETHYFALSGSITALPEDHKVTYALLWSYEESLRELREARQTLWFVSLAGLLISAGMVWIFVGRATEPLRRLRDAAEAVGRGDFSRRVDVATKDEFGALGQTFNQMSANLESSRKELEKTLDTLKSTQAQLIQGAKLSAVGEFVAGVAHELNNPLTSLIGFAELLQSSGVDEKQSSHLNFIVKSSQRCHRIVQSLLSFARQHAPERTTLKIAELLDSVVDLLSYEMRTSNIQIKTRYESSLPLIIGDSHQLQQVILNILNNARQAILGAKRNGEIRITAERAGHLVKVTISDSGPGISAENLQKIFDPFFTTKPVGQGTGLGLSLCYGIVKEHGGMIQATSEMGAGATFTIELPAASASQIATANRDAANDEVSGVALTGKRVLVIDDEEWILTMTRTVLEEEGYQVDIALDGDQALAAMTKARYDLLVCDQKMPGLSGTQFYQRLVEDDPEAAKRVIFMTGDVVNENFQEFLRETRKSCLTKPFSLTQLRTTVAGAIHE